MAGDLVIQRGEAGRECTPGWLSGCEYDDHDVDVWRVASTVQNEDFLDSMDWARRHCYHPNVFHSAKNNRDNFMHQT